jgi:hypothetical protein
VIVTTPNVLSLPSRLRTLAWGFPELFDPLPLTGADERLLGGHIHPVAPYNLALALLEENRALLRALGGLGMLTARTVILCARKPSKNRP